jgi:hypothetical protein
MLGVVDPETAIAGGAARAIREGANATKWQAATISARWAAINSRR